MSRSCNGVAGSAETVGRWRGKCRTPWLGLRYGFGAGWCGVGGVHGLSAALDCYLAAVADGLLVRSSDADVLAEVRGFETLRRRLDGFDLDVLPELERRGLPGVLGGTGWARCDQPGQRLAAGHAVKAKSDCLSDV